MPTDIEYLSAEKIAELKKELFELTTVKRLEIAEALEQAKALGDLRENAEYQETRLAQASLEERIAYLTSILKRAVLLETKDAGGTATIGARVTIQKTGNSSPNKIQLVGSSEANINTNKISISSPVGKAMMGKKAGDKFSVQVNGNSVEYKIISID